MKVIRARTAGFCFGVTRAIEIAERAAESGKRPLYTPGPLIHNRQVVDELAERGVEVEEDIARMRPGGTVIVRAHGITAERRREMEAKGLDILDATCPHVLQSQERLEEYTRKGFRAVILGDAAHAEVRALLGYVYTEAVVVASIEEARAVEFAPPVCVLAQTTFHASLYGRIVDVLRERYADAVVFDSICSSTAARQREAAELARRVEAVVVVGGRHSANTVRLAEIAREAGVPAFLVEEAAELDLAEMACFATVGVTAGASTPAEAIDGVAAALEALAGEKDNS